MKPLRAGVLVPATVITLMWAPTALAHEGTEDPAPKDNTTTTEPTNTKSAAATHTAKSAPLAETARTRHLENRAMWLKRAARGFTKLMRQEPQRVNRRPSEFESLLRYRIWLRRAWHLRAQRARYRAHHPPHLEQWRCIHRWEGSWKDPGSPYYGGLQMDLTFQRAYGAELLRREGTADNWAAFEQMWVAERALEDGRGFYPWPISAGLCGLL